MEQLSQEQLDEIKNFFEGTGAKMISHMQNLHAAKWMTSESVQEREQCWHMIQAIFELETLLKNAKANNELTQRVRARLEKIVQT